MNTAILGFITPWVIYTIITILHYVLPGHWVTGYVENEKTGEKLRYRLNGIYVLISSIVLWFGLGYLGWVPFEWLYSIRWYSLAGAFTIGLLYTFITVLPHPSTGKSFVSDLFLGRLKNPQYAKGRIDAKMWLYLVGAVMLELNVLSFAAYHHISFGAQASAGIFLCAAMLTFFVFDYLTFEEVHLYTYDFFAERVGFKLGWGCLVFYPFFYSIALWSSAGVAMTHIPTWLLLVSGLIFLIGWTLARGANMQKFYFKTRPEKAFLGMQPKTISNGEYTLLVNGFWGFSRHINYLGEILMGCGIALAVGGAGGFWPWLYPLYYVALLLPRQLDDDKRCALKYGELWGEYKSIVRFKVIPFLY